MTFKWDSFFETGIEVIDRQHLGLVALINDVAPLLASTDQPDRTQVEVLLDQLFAYAAMHFKTEEGLMALQGVDARYCHQHSAIHRQFVDQLIEMRTAFLSGQGFQIGPTLLKFLTSWLTIHILDEDQRLARHLTLIASGVAPQTAYSEVAADTHTSDPARAALESALIDLYAVLEDRNKILRAVNQDLIKARDQLELRVEERTRDLSAALEQTRITQGQLLQSEKMAAVGQLAAGVAHEINNPVGFVNSNLGSLKTYVAQLLDVITAYESMDAAAPPGDAARLRVEHARAAADMDYLKKDIVELLDESLQGLGRVKKIVQDLKDFSHVDQTEWQETDINTGLESTLNVLASDLRYKAKVTTHFAKLPLLHCVPSQLNQVFMNLLVNAAQSLEDTGRPGQIDVTTGYSDEVVWAEISDNGKGMPDAVQTRIFEPFYTTKPVGKGTGLGLSISFDIVEKKHGGRIQVESMVDKGSTFRVLLPRRAHRPLAELER
jgi:two-component system NtrC family sensor kinase